MEKTQNISLTNTHHWKLNVVMMVLSQILVMSGFCAAMPFIPLYLKEGLGIINESDRGLYLSLFNFFGMFAYSIFNPFWGALSDRWGVKPMLLRGTFLTAVFFPMMAYVTNVWLLIALRFITAACAGTTVAAQTLLVKNTPEDKQGFALGMLTTAYFAGIMLGNVIGGLVVSYYGYHNTFWFCGILYFAAGIAVVFAKDDFNVKLAKKERSKGQYTFRETATPAVLWILVLFLFMGTSSRLVQPYMALLVEAVHGFKGAAFYTGIVSAASSAGGFFSGLCIGWLCDRIAPRKLLLPILLFGTVATTAIALSHNVEMLILTRFLAAFAVSGIQPVLQLMLTKITRKELRGTYFGWSASVNTAGGIICSFLGGSVVWLTGVRGIYMTAAIILALMIPLMLPAVRAMKKEYVVPPDATAENLKNNI